MNKLEDHIDEPIKKCVMGLSLLGFETLFSCCGFTYKDEKVTKAHIKNKPYVFIKTEKLTPELKTLLVDLSLYSYWTISRPFNSVIDFHGHGWNGDNPWNYEGCPHKPEPYVLSIDALEKALDKFEHLMKDEVSIIDGNAEYIRVYRIRNWQYPACEPWNITKKDYLKLV